VFRRLTGRRGDDLDLESVREQAFEAVEEGRPMEALELADRAVAQARSAFGEHPRLAEALFMQSMIRLSIGDPIGAAESCAAAAAIPSIDDATEKDRITYAWNEGQMLIQGGQVAAALKVLRRNVEERRAFYTEGHPGVAFGLDSLATALLAAGDLDAAGAAIDEAIAIDREAGHPALGSNLMVRAAIDKAGDPSTDAAASIRDLPSELDEEVLLAARELLDAGLPGALDAMWDIVSASDIRSRLDPGQRREATVVVVNAARTAGRHELVLEAARIMAAEAAADGASRDLADAHQIASIALDELNRPDEAETELEAAAEVAERAGGRETLATIRRSQAIRLADEKRFDEARSAHLQSIEAGAASGRHDLHGKALGAYAIMLQHSGALDEAQTMFPRALELLPSNDEDLPFVDSHARALARGESCGCPDDSSLSDWLRRMVEEHVPADLIESVDLRPGGEIDIRLARQPTAAEEEALDRAFRLATATLRGAGRRG
jgi:tetratricopeptide (TPR) repeat protein